MARVTDLLSSLGVAEDGISTVYPETFTDDITGAYNDDIAVYEAKILTLETALAEAQEKITALQVHNYELMTSSPAVADSGESDDSDAESDSDDDSDENRGVDSLFKEKDNS